RISGATPSPRPSPPYRGARGIKGDAQLPAFGAAGEVAPLTGVQIRWEGKQQPKPRTSSPSTPERGRGPGGGGLSEGAAAGSRDSTGVRRGRGKRTSMVQDLAQEQLRALGLGIVEEGMGFVLLDDLAPVHEDDPVRHRARKAHLMGDADHGHA